MAGSSTKVVVAPLAAEVLSSFLVCAALLSLEVHVELLSRLPWYIIGVDNYNNGHNEREVYCDYLSIKRDKRGSLRITKR